MRQCNSASVLQSEFAGTSAFPRSFYPYLILATHTVYHEIVVTAVSRLRECFHTILAGTDCVLFQLRVQEFQDRGKNLRN